MKTRTHPSPPPHGFTLLEGLLTVAILAILAALLLPALQGAKGKAQRTRCANNLRQVGVGFHSWAHEHGDQFPMSVPTNAGGTAEFAQTGPSLSAFRHFQVLSNELVVPKILLCPVDTRPAAHLFDDLQNTNVSYLVNTRASFGKADSVLAADRNMRTSGRMEYDYMQFGPGDVVEWSSSLHGFRGNVVFGDSHLDAVAMSDATRLLTNGGDVVLVLPQPGTPVTGPPATGTDGAPSPSTAKPAAPTAIPPSATSTAAPPPAAVIPSTPPPPPYTASPGRTLTRARARTDARDETPALIPGVFTPTHLQPATPTPRVSDMPSGGAPSESEDEATALSGKWLGYYGSRATYSLLALLLAIFIAIEVMRRRRKQNPPK